MLILQVLIVGVLGVLAIYGAHLMWKAGTSSLKRGAAIVGSWGVALSVMASTTPMSAQSLNLDIDLSPLFDSINQFFPVMLGVLIVPAGIMAALYLARYIVSLVVRAFSGQSM